MSVTISERLLESLMRRIEHDARASIPHYDRSARRYVWNDKVWKLSDPYGFEMIELARKALNGGQTANE